MKESWRLALSEFTKKYGYTKDSSPISIFAAFSLVLLLINPALFPVPVILFIILKCFACSVTLFSINSDMNENNVNGARITVDYQLSKTSRRW